MPNVLYVQPPHASSMLGGRGGPVGNRLLERPYILAGCNPTCVRLIPLLLDCKQLAALMKASNNQPHLSIINHTFEHHVQMLCS